MIECWRAEPRPHNVLVMQSNPSEVISEFRVRPGWQAEPRNADVKLMPSDIAHFVHAMLALRDAGFSTDASVWRCILSATQLPDWFGRGTPSARASVYERDSVAGHRPPTAIYWAPGRPAQRRYPSACSHPRRSGASLCC